MRVLSTATLMWSLPATILLVSGVPVRFTPPTRIQQLAAIGPTVGLPEPLRRALDPRDDFQALPAPGPGDWLANHPEAGQTFEQFLRFRPNRPDECQRVLYLQPLGDFSERVSPSLAQLQQLTAAFFMLNVKVLPPLGLDQARITRRRNPASGQMQLLTTDILTLLGHRRPADCFALVGVTMIDLYPDPTWNFVFGQASPQDPLGVYSFARYNPRFYGEAVSADSHKLMLRRSFKVLAHETGHMFGIEHCVWYRCLMNGSNHLAESDARPLHLCPVDLRKLQWSIGFDVAERYRRLRDLNRRAGFEDEAQWLDKRIRFIVSHDQNHEAR